MVMQNAPPHAPPHPSPVPFATRAWRLALLLLAVAAVGFIGSMVTQPKIPTWYASLYKPTFTPPAWVFGPVWTTLYVAMAVAACRVWNAPGDWEPRRAALAFFALQLLLNAAWSPVFFGAESPVWGVAVILPLFVTVLITTYAFFSIDRVAGFLLLPYLGWVGYASALNIAIVVLNPT